MYKKQYKFHCNKTGATVALGMFSQYGIWNKISCRNYDIYVGRYSNLKWKSKIQNCNTGTAILRLYFYGPYYKIY